MNHYIENYPPDNLDKGFDFAELSAIGTALEEMYGPRGGRGLALRAGRATFADALKNFGALAGAARPGICRPAASIQAENWPAGLRQDLLPVERPAQLRSRKRILNSSGPSINAPSAGGRTNVDKPVCYVATGLLQESLKWVSGGNEFRVNESKCVAMGDAVCEFVIQKEPIS
ncbi:MAG: 4-vinyl reductase [Desulfobacterales bacterium]|nr:4-vinyl reductase [Desulfobacterales bacterium]